MKKAMCRVDPSGGFRFSDKDDPAQMHLFSEFTDQAMANELRGRFAGQSVRVYDVKEFVLAETPACTFKACLKAMEVAGLIRPIDAPPNRRKGTSLMRTCGSSSSVTIRACFGERDAAK